LNLGWTYYVGYKVSIDYLKAKKYLEIGVSLKNSESMVFLGEIYHYGKGVEINREKSFFTL